MRQFKMMIINCTEQQMPCDLAVTDINDINKIQTGRWGFSTIGNFKRTVFDESLELTGKQKTGTALRSACTMLSKVLGGAKIALGSRIEAILNIDWYGGSAIHFGLTDPPLSPEASQDHSTGHLEFITFGNEEDNPLRFVDGDTLLTWPEGDWVNEPSHNMAPFANLTEMNKSHAKTLEDYAASHPHTVILVAHPAHITGLKYKGTVFQSAEVLEGQINSRKAQQAEAKANNIDMNAQGTDLERSIKDQDTWSRKGHVVHSFGS
jgi:hypothetical protein